MDLDHFRSVQFRTFEGNYVEGYHRAFDLPFTEADYSEHNKIVNAVIDFVKQCEMLIRNRKYFYGYREFILYTINKSLYWRLDKIRLKIKNWFHE